MIVASLRGGQGAVTGGVGAWSPSSAIRDYRCLEGLTQSDLVGEEQDPSLAVEARHTAEGVDAAEAGPWGAVGLGLGCVRLPLAVDSAQSIAQPCIQ